MSVIVVLLSALFPASAQNYTTDAILKRTTGKIATLECSGIARTKKEAIEMAKKSVIYTYLYNGIDGLNDNKPLLGSKPSAGAAQYVGQLLGTTRYANYIRSCTIADKTNKTAAKDIQVFATIDLYTESLERDLVNNGIIGRNAADIALSETQEMIAMPTVMVVPFRKSGQSYEEAIRDNSDMRMAISKVNEGFIKQGVETKDLLTSLNNANTYQVRMGDGMSLDDAILINSGADVSVSVDINQDVNDGGVVGLGAGSVPFQTWYLHRRGLDVGPGVGLMTLQYVFHKTAVLLYATVLLLAGRPWMAAHSDGVLRYLPGAYAVVAGVIVGLIALCALPVVQRLARWLLHFLPNTGRWAERRESWLKQLDTLSTESRHQIGRASCRERV